MPCISWPAIRGISAVALALALTTRPAAAAPELAAAGHVVVIDDAVTGKALLSCFDYVGKWQHVRNKNDGRTAGTSTRSTHLGDVAILRFTGTRVRIYGILGPSGGRAGIALDEKSTGAVPVDFYSPRVRTHAMVYQSPVLPSGVHDVTLIVWGTRDPHGRFYYVNIDGAEVDDAK